MTGNHQVGKIQISEDMPFQKKEWLFQRIGWAALLVIMALALMGVFGRGRVAKDSVGDPATFGIEFERILRHGADTRLEIDVGPGLQRDSTLRIIIARDYFEKFDVEQIVPEPLGSGLNGDFVYYDFERKDSRVPVRIVFGLVSDHYFGLKSSIGIDGATTLTFGQFVLP